MKEATKINQVIKFKYQCLRDDVERSKKSLIAMMAKIERINYPPNKKKVQKYIDDIKMYLEQEEILLNLYKNYHQLP